MAEGERVMPTETRPVFRHDIDGAWLIVVIRPDEAVPEVTGRHIDTYKLPSIPEHPELVAKMARDLRDLADDLERRGWRDAFTPEDGRNG